MVYNVYMIRKQFYVTPEIDRALVILARQEGKPVAEIVREVLEKSLKTPQKPKSAGQVLLDLANMGFKGGPKDLSSNLFDYLYGDKSPNYGRSKKAIRRR